MPQDLSHCHVARLGQAKYAKQHPCNGPRILIIGAAASRKQGSIHTSTLTLLLCRLGRNCLQGSRITCSMVNSWYNRLRLRLLGNKDHTKQYTVESSGLTRRQIEVGQKALKVLGLTDPDNLTKQNVVIFLYAVGLNPTDDVLDSKFRQLQLYNQDALTFGQVCHVWHSMLQDLTDEEEILRRAFQFFDKDGNNEISVAELKNTMQELGNLLTEQEIMDFMQAMDVNNDGVIGYQEFLDVLRTQSVGAGASMDGSAAFDSQRPSRQSGSQQQQVGSAQPQQLAVTGGVA